LLDGAAIINITGIPLNLI